MNYKGYTAIIEFDEQAGIFHGEIAFASILYVDVARFIAMEIILVSQGAVQKSELEPSPFPGATTMAL